VAPGHRVLDVACGTGIVTRTAADRVAPDGRTVGVDLNDAMLSVARRVRPDIEFRQADAARLPFADESFDTVLSQMALMFFPDRGAAVREMSRVTTSGGTVALLVPGAHEHQQAFAQFADLAVRHAGDEARSLLSTYFLCGDLDQLASLVESTGLQVRTARTVVGAYRAPSVDAFVTTEVESTSTGLPAPGGCARLGGRAAWRRSPWARRCPTGRWPCLRSPRRGRCGPVWVRVPTQQTWDTLAAQTANLNGERRPGERKPARAEAMEDFLGYCRQRLADDPHLWSTTLFDEVVGLGFTGSYQAFTGSVRRHELRPRCVACAAARSKDRSVIEHPAGRETPVGLARCCRTRPRVGVRRHRASACRALPHSSRWRGWIAECEDQSHLIEGLRQVATRLGRPDASTAGCAG
jgi:SAM-dependent methyltransferase